MHGSGKNSRAFVRSAEVVKASVFSSLKQGCSNVLCNVVYMVKYQAPTRQSLRLLDIMIHHVASAQSVKASVSASTVYIHPSCSLSIKCQGAAHRAFVCGMSRAELAVFRVNRLM